MSADAFPPDFERLDVANDGIDEPLELADLLNTALDKGVILHGNLTIAVADVDLVQLNLGLLLAALETTDRGGREAVSHSLAGTLGSPTYSPAEQGQGRPGAAVTAAEQTAPASSLPELAPGLPGRINADPDRVESGLARLVLTLVEVLRKVLEHQAVRRMDGGRLSAEEVERLGLALARLSDRMQDLKQVFGLSDEDLQIDLGPLGRVR